MKLKKRISDFYKGKTLNEETKTKISLWDAMTGEKNPMFVQNHSDVTRQKISDAKKGKPRPEGQGIPSQAIEVTDIKNDTTTSYDSISEAAIALNINHSVIVMYFSRNQKKSLIKVSILSISYNYFSSTLRLIEAGCASICC